MTLNNKISVMIVDDSKFMRVMIADVLKGQGDIEVIALVEDGQEALSKLETISPDVILLDLKMPKIDGITVLKKLKQRQSKIRVIVVSAYALENTELILNNLEGGAIDFLLKPTMENGHDLNKFSNVN